MAAVKNFTALNVELPYFFFSKDRDSVIPEVKRSEPSKTKNHKEHVNLYHSDRHSHRGQLGLEKHDCLINSGSFTFLSQQT